MKIRQIVVKKYGKLDRNLWSKKKKSGRNILSKIESKIKYGQQDRK